MITTTLKQISEQNPCEAFLVTLMQSFDTKPGDEEPFPLSHVLRSNGLEDTLWYMLHLPEHDDLWRHFSIDCAEHVSHLMTDQRSLDALKVARRYADGNATSDELKSAREAARDASTDVEAAIAGDDTKFSGWLAAQAAWATTRPASRFLDAVDYADEDRAWQKRQLGRYLDLGKRPD